MSGPPQFPPGWYPEGAHLRWWDGANWGPYAPATPTGPPQSEEERGRTMAVVSHLGFIAGGFILPLVLYLIEKGKPDRNRFVCHHACEALNFAITFMVVWIGGFVLMFATLPFTVDTSDSPAFPWPLAVLFPLMMLSMLSTYVFGILAMVRANKGVWWRYPVSIRFVGRGIDWRTA
ncbi:MAG: DUF4870 domain-containing protein [Acidimicrobiales bacterium]